MKFLFRWIKQEMLAMGLAGILTLLFFLPLLPKMTHVLPSQADGVLIAYLIHWVSYALLHHTSLFQVPFFSPFSNTLAYSDPFLSTGLLNIPIFLLTQNIVLASNLHLLLGTFFTFLAMYFLSYTLEKSKIAALFSASIFTFSSLHFQFIFHLHTYLLAGIPSSILAFLTWEEALQKHKKNAALFLFLAAGGFLYQVFNSPMTGFFLAFIFLPILLQKNHRTFLLQQKKSVASVGALTLLLCSLFYWPYFQVAHQFQYTRSIRDAAHFASSLDFFFQTDVLLLAATTILFFIKRPKKKQQNATITSNTLLFICAIGTLLMLGPALKLHDQTLKIFQLPIPLPYALLYYIIPGFKAFRATARWVIVLDFGLSLLIGRLFHHVHIPNWQKNTIFFFTLIFFWMTQVPTMQLYEIPMQVPTIYQVVKNRPEHILAEFPVYSWGMFPYAYIENDRLLDQAEHQKTLYNGVSGFTPPERVTEWDWLWKNFPSDDTMFYLKKQGVQLVLIHFAEYQNMWQDHYIYADVPSQSGSELQQKLLQQTHLHVISCQETDCLYKIE